MGFRFYRRVRIAPGIRLNFGTRGASVSFGHRGCWYTTGAHGRRTATLGFPGTGLRYTTTTGGSARSGSRQASKPAPGGIGGLFVLALAVAGVWFVYHVATALGIGG